MLGTTDHDRDSDRDGAARVATRNAALLIAAGRQAGRSAALVAELHDARRGYGRHRAFDGERGERRALCGRRGRRRRSACVSGQQSEYATPACVPRKPSRRDSSGDELLPAAELMRRWRPGAVTADAEIAGRSVTAPGVGVLSPNDAVAAALADTAGDARDRRN